MDNIFTVLLIVLIVWIGIAALLLRIDFKIRKLQKLLHSLNKDEQVDA